MKVCGFTIARNVQKYDYPIVEAIQSTLPLCDEFVVGFAKSEDGTLEIIQSVDSPKIRIVSIDWPEAMRSGGHVLAHATTQTLRQCSGDWAFYVQADEVVHEKYHDTITESMKRYGGRNDVEGLVFRYVHFYGSYEFYQDDFLHWYPRAVRVVRPWPQIVSWGDGCSFRYHAETKTRKLRTKPSGAYIYHYGWVKPKALMTEKERNLESLYNDDEYLKQKYELNTPPPVFEHYGHLAVFKGTHPKVMRKRVESQDWTFDAKIETQWPAPIRRIWLWMMFPWTKLWHRITGA